MARGRPLFMPTCCAATGAPVHSRCDNELMGMRLTGLCLSFCHKRGASRTTLKILIGLSIEERELAAPLGARYSDYRRRVPMIVPELAKRQTHAARIVSAAILNNCSHVAFGERIVHNRTS